MLTDDLKTLKERKKEIFEGIGQVLANVELGHLQIAGLELEPSSIKTDRNQELEKVGLFELNKEITCKEGYKLQEVVRINPRTGDHYTIYICVPVDKK